MKDVLLVLIITALAVTAIFNDFRLTSVTERDQNLLGTCRKAHDVYACQLVAVPVPALPAATNT